MTEVGSKNQEYQPSQQSMQTEITVCGKMNLVIDMDHTENEGNTYREKPLIKF